MSEKKQFRVVCMITEPTLNDAIVTAVRVNNNIEGVDVALTQLVNDSTVGTIVNSRNVWEFVQSRAAEKEAGWSVSFQGSGDLIKDGFETEDDAYQYLSLQHCGEIPDGYIVEQENDDE